MDSEQKNIPLTNEQIDTLMAKSPELEKQTYEQIDSITPLSSCVISRQATLNIGTIGHVAHGKSTLVRAISGVNTVKFKNEKVRNITIRLGYANAKIYKKEGEGPECYLSYSSDHKDEVVNETGTYKLIRHISFVDCPGHDILMSTMLTGAAVMDAALLLVAGNMPCPQPQTSEHLAAVDIMKLEHIIIIQNKVDIIFKDDEAAKNNYNQIKEFIQGTKAELSPIVPISAQLKYNIDAVLKQICTYFPTPSRELKINPKMIIIRSFDINKPGKAAEMLTGGVVGGSILQGVLKIGDVIEIRPGNQSKVNGKLTCVPIRSRIVSLESEANHLLYAVPGGLIGVGLMIDPSITRNDKLVGNVLGLPGQLPDTYTEIEINFFLLRRLIGAKAQSGDQKTKKISKITVGETLKFNVGSTQSPGKVISVKDTRMKVELTQPICTQVGEKVAYSRRIDNTFRLIGWGEIKSGKQINS